MSSIDLVEFPELYCVRPVQAIALSHGPKFDGAVIGQMEFCWTVCNQLPAMFWSSVAVLSARVLHAMPRCAG